MFYIILTVIGVLFLQYYLAKYVIAGIILPLTSGMAVIMALLMIFTGEGGGDLFHIHLLLLFLILFAASLLLYSLRRRGEYRKGYMDDQGPYSQKEPETEDEENH